MNKFLHYLLLSFPLILCSENYVMENIKHQAVFFVSPVGQPDNSNFLSMAFPEIYRKVMTSRRVVSPAELPSIKGDIELTIFLGSSVSKRDISALSGMGGNVKHITIIGGDDLSFSEKHRVTSLILLNFRPVDNRTVFHELMHTWSDDGESNDKFKDSHTLESLFTINFNNWTSYKYEYKKIFE